MNIILIDKYNPFNTSSASANRTRSLIEGLVLLGVNVQIVITGGYQSRQEKSKMGRYGKMHEVEYLYLRTRYSDNIWKKRLDNYILDPLQSSYIIFSLKKLIKDQPHSIIWISNDLIHLKAITGVSSKKHYSFIELNEYGDVYKYHSRNSLQRYFAKKAQSYFEKRAYFSLDGIALMTKTLYNHYQTFSVPGPKLFHLPMTVDLNRFDISMKYEKPCQLSENYIAFIGDMNNHKDGVDILINSFAKIADEFPLINLYLFGYYFYDLPGHLEQIKKLGLENRVNYKGSVERDQIPNIIMNATLLVLARPDSKQAQGGFPTKLGEYLATANPVCVTKVGEIPDYLEDEVSAFLAEPGNVESFANAMHRALSKPDLAKKVGLNGRKVAELCFNKDIQAKLLYNFLLNLSDNSTNSPSQISNVT